MRQSEILVIGVIYNTFEETLRYLDSVAETETGNLTLILVDNSDRPVPAGFGDEIARHPFALYLKTGQNMGYFGGARSGLDHYLARNGGYPRWVLVTNVDIRFTGGFFEQLQSLPEDERLGLVAPSIISQRWGRDYNPKIMNRYSAGRLRFYLVLYSCFLFHNLYLAGSYLKSLLYGLKRRTARAEKAEGEFRRFYAAHGSCMVFHRNFFNHGGTLEIPVFLFGEEIFVAEQAKSAGLDIVYHPELVIHDHEHASTGWFISPRINAYHRQAIRAILEKYYQGT
jgi:GT2 family glycosyltransferase